MSNIATVPKTEVEYIPFGSDEKIRLSIEIIQKYVAAPSRSGKLPDQRECVQFMMLCRSRKLNPFEGDAFLIGYDGQDGTKWSLITAHSAFLKRAENHPEYDGMKSGVIVRDEEGKLQDREGDFFFDDDKLLGAWATVYFKVRKYPMNKRVKLMTFQKSFGVWKTDPAGMIVKCAEADALRSSFPSLLGGLYTREERFDDGATATVTAKAPSFENIVSFPTQKANDAPAAPAPQAATESAKVQETDKGATQAPAAGDNDGDLGPAAQPAGMTEEVTKLASDLAAFAKTEGEDDEAAYKRMIALVHTLLGKAGVTEAQLLAHGRKDAWVKAGQKSIGDLTASKLVNVGKAFGAMLPAIRQQKA